MKPEAGQRVYWTKVSTNTKVRIGHIANKWCANTIVQLQSWAAA
jgi:hypothetical protein